MTTTPGAIQLDGDGDGSLEPLTDGVLLLRYLFGFTGPVLVDGAVGANCTRCDGPAVQTYLSGLGLVLDIDGNGVPRPAHRWAAGPALPLRLHRPGARQRRHRRGLLTLRRSDDHDLPAEHRLTTMAGSGTKVIDRVGRPSVSPGMAARRLATASSLAALLLGAPGFAAKVRPAGVEAVTERIATTNLGCDVPLLGNHCLIVPCPTCMGLIPDLGSLVRSLVISEAQVAELGLEDCTVNRVKVAIELGHTYVADLVISLAHQGADVTLYANEDCGADTGVDAVFSDLAQGAPNACPAIEGKSFRPHEPLAAFAGAALVGTWTLSIEDIFDEDAGMLDKVAFAFDATCSGDGTAPAASLPLRRHHHRRPTACHACVPHRPRAFWRIASR